METRNRTTKPLAMVALAVVMAISSSALAQSKFAVAGYSWDGSLNPGFGGSGLVATDFPPAAGAWARAMTVDSSGKIVVVGGDSDGHFALARYNPDGTLDGNFGLLGRVVTSLGANTQARANAVAIDGGSEDIVVAGEVWQPADGPNGNTDFAIARYDQYGNLEWTVQTSFPADPDYTGGLESAKAVAIDGQGRIVVAGVAEQVKYFDSPSPALVDQRIALARYYGNGAPDLTFDGDGNFDGKVTYNFHVTQETFEWNREQANAIAFSGSHILVAAHWVLGYPENDWYWSEFVALRFTGDGSLFSGFGQGGISTPFGAAVTPSAYKTVGANAIAVDYAGKIYVAGKVYSNGNIHFALARLDSSGNLDPSFDGDGKRHTVFGVRSNVVDSEARAMKLSQGKILLAGWSGSNPDSRVFALARYNDDGSHDTTFDGDGTLTTDFTCQGSEEAYALALRYPFGINVKPNIYVAGRAAGALCR